MKKNKENYYQRKKNNNKDLKIKRKNKVEKYFEKIIIENYTIFNCSSN